MKNNRIKYKCKGCGKEEPSAMATYYVEQLGGNVEDLELYCLLCALTMAKEKKDV